MSWYLLPSGLPFFTDDGESLATILVGAGATILDDDDVAAAIEAWANRVPGPTGRPIDFVTETELAEALAGLGISVGDATTTAKGIVELATGTEAAAGTDTTRAITPAALKAVLDGLTFTPADASTTVKGVVELATSGETATGTSGTLAVTPSGLKSVTDLLQTQAGLPAAIAAVAVPRWQPNTAYAAGTRVIAPTTGSVVSRKSDGTSSATYDPANWTDLTAALSDTRGRRAAALPVKRVVVIVDDSRLDAVTVAAPAIEAVGGKFTLAISMSHLNSGASFMVNADVTSMWQRGHQIADHGINHLDMTVATAAQRQPEWDMSKAQLEALTAVGAITDFVYPNNAANLVTQREAYKRFLRTFAGLQFPTSVYDGEPTGLGFGRFSWNTTTHAKALDRLRAAAPGETLIIFTHQVSNAGATSVSQAQFQEFVDLATALGFQFVRADEALPPYRGFGLAIGDTGLPDNTVRGTGTITNVQDAQLEGRAGDRSIKMTHDGTSTSDQLLSWGSIFVEPGQTVQASALLRVEKTSGNGGGFNTVREYDEFGGQIGGNYSSPALTAAGSTAWTQLTVTRTASATCRRIGFFTHQSQMVGDVYVRPQVDFGRAQYAALA